MQRDRQPWEDNWDKAREKDNEYTRERNKVINRNKTVPAYKYLKEMQTIHQAKALEYKRKLRDFNKSHLTPEVLKLKKEREGLWEKARAEQGAYFKKQESMQPQTATE